MCICDPMNVQRIKQVAVKYGLFADEIGKTRRRPRRNRLDGKTAISPLSLS